MRTLQSYVTELQRLLHDALNQYYTQQEMIDYINAGRRRVVGDSGCLRNLQTIYVSTGLETYGYGMVSGGLVTAGGSGYTNSSTVSFTGGGGTGATGNLTITNGAVTQVNITNGGSGYTGAPTAVFSGPGSGAAATMTVFSASTNDILNVSVIWGQLRIALQDMPWTEFNAKMRTWQQLLSRPLVFSRYGQTQFYIGPIPDQTYATEVDTVLVPPDLVNLTDVDVINEPWTHPVCFYAAYQAKLKEQSGGESDHFKSLYIASLKDSYQATTMRRIPWAYA